MQVVYFKKKTIWVKYPFFRKLIETIFTHADLGDQFLDSSLIRLKSAHAWVEGHSMKNWLYALISIKVQ